MRLKSSIIKQSVSIATLDENCREIVMSSDWALSLLIESMRYLASDGQSGSKQTQSRHGPRWRHNWRSYCLSGLLRPLERRRSRHSRPERCQGGVREAAVTGGSPPPTSALFARAGVEILNCCNQGIALTTRSKRRCYNHHARARFGGCADCSCPCRYGSGVQSCSFSS
jgi:hypothetical protein